MIYLHKTSTKSPNIKNKMSENYILSKNIQKCVIFVFIKTRFFGQDFENISFLHYSAIFLSIFLYFESSFR